MSEIEAGDRVRVVLEGVVSTPYRSANNSSAKAFFIGTGNGKSVGVVYDETLATEIHVEKRKPQVGDVIPAGVLRFLPAGTILLTDNGVAWSKTRAEGRWASWFRPIGLTDEEFFRPRFAQGDLTIVYLP